MENIEIANKLEKVADLLEIQGANPFRVRAYRNASRIIEGYGEPLRKLVEQGADLREIEGVGEDMAGYIEELVKTGKLEALEELESEVPPGLMEVTRLEGVGPKRAAKLWKELGVTSLEELQEAAEEGRIAELKGFGKKTEKSILERIKDYQAEERRHLLSDADQFVDALLEHMKQAPHIDRVEVAGSWRRRKETVGDLDVLVTTTKGNRPVVDHFTGWGSVERVLQDGDTRASVVLSSGLQVDLRVVPPESFGAAMVYFTGSKAHSIKLRRRALDRDLHVSEYGVFEVSEGKKPSEGKRVAGAEEDELYDTLDLPFIPPELREDRGEIEAAAEEKLPKLVEVEDLRGDLQMHSTWTDGRASLRQMFEGCRSLGYEYAAITDHSQSLAMAGGLDKAKLKRQWKEIDKLQEEYDDIQLLRGIEVDILEDGSLDLDDDVLGDLDVVLATVHGHFDLPSDEQTKRLVTAMKNRSVHILGHPTGRLIGTRSPMRFDMDEVLKVAKNEGVVMELDAAPERLDLADTHLIQAKEVGVKIVIDSDAHSVRGLERIRYGVDQARRAWLEKKDVINTKSLKSFRKALRG
jgi:DNA polymerase (family 10)